MKNIEKILDKVEYEKKVNAALTTKIDTEYRLVENKRRLSKLKNVISLDRSVKLSGVLLYLISIIGLIATTSLSVAGGIDRYSGIARTAFIISICFVQLVIFTVSAKDTIIRKQFNVHYAKFKLLQAGLLMVSVYYSYEFYIKHIDNPSSIVGIAVTILLCCLVDFSTIALVSLAFDKRMLNYTEPDNIETRNLLYMLFYNKIFGIRLKAFRSYKTNVETIKAEVETGSNNPEILEPIRTENVLEPIEFLEPEKLESIDNTTPEKVKTENGLELIRTKSKIVSIKKIRTENGLEPIRTYLKENYTFGQWVKSGEIKEKFNLSAKEWLKVKEQIEELESTGTKTFYKPTELRNLNNER
jgi:hypothetical protein